jgi:sugar/nucleoside kinase (ribokinase family)
MTDVAVVGAPFLDLTFEGMERLPHIGEELIARRLHIGPGGSGMQAIGSARLGLQTVLVAPMGSGAAAKFLRDVLVGEGVGVSPSPADRGEETGGLEVPVTALLCTPDGVAMATGLGGIEPAPDDVAGAHAGSVVLSLGRLHLAPQATAVYVVTGSVEVARVDDGVLRRLANARALILNAAEAIAITGESDVEHAARRLAGYGPTVVVTMGADGAMGVQRQEAAARVAAPQVEVIDATGAGDLFVAAYVWADVRGAALADALAWASLYAGLSVRSPTAFGGAVRLNQLLQEGLERELPPPPQLHRGDSL